MWTPRHEFAMFTGLRLSISVPVMPKVGMALKNITMIIIGINRTLPTITISIHMIHPGNDSWLRGGRGVGGVGWSALGALRNVSTGGTFSSDTYIRAVCAGAWLI